MDDPLRDWFGPRLTAPRIVADEPYLDVTSYLPAGLVDDVRREVHRAMHLAGKRRDLHIAATGATPRRYRLLGRSGLAEHSRLIPALYRSQGLLAFLARLTGESLAPVPYEPEEFIATRYERPGDTHGWHWDDYGYALIWVLDAPNEVADGGSLEYVPNVAWNKAAPETAHHIRQGPIRLRHPKAGTVYLLRTDTTLHRVTPIRGGAHREILCLSYARPADLTREISHETLEQLNSIE